jgi:16S rRNA pseudouridine516 synthase
VNGITAMTGQEVSPGIDTVTVGGRRIDPAAQRTYLMLNKPVGVLSSVGDDRGRKTVTDGLPASLPRVFPVGRLDLDSRGLVLLTDDGELAVRLMHPRYHVEKEYRVVIAGRPDAETLQQLSRGVVVRGERYQPAEVRVLQSSATDTRLAMVLREGRKREVRRLWQVLGHRVLDLQRVRIASLELGDLPEGQVRPLSSLEVTALRAAAGT